MADVEVLKRRKITETLLEQARRALPPEAEQHATLLAQYREFLDHREHELALDILEEIGRLVPCRGGFWRDLERAAENMGLNDSLPALRNAFLHALKQSH